MNVTLLGTAEALLEISTNLCSLDFKAIKIPLEKRSYRDALSASACTLIDDLD